MDSELFRKIENVNECMAAHLAAAKLALSGEGEFGVVQVRALSQLLSEMQPIMAGAGKLRALHPEIAAPLERYKAHLKELDIALQMIHVMLNARRAQMEAGRVQLDAVASWTNAFNQTR